MSERDAAEQQGSDGYEPPCAEDLPLTGGTSETASMVIPVSGPPPN